MMYKRQQPKPFLTMNILRRHTDEGHRLSHKEIADILKAEYDMVADRKTIRRNLMNLMDCGYHIEYTETLRMVPNAKTEDLICNYDKYGDISNYRIDHICDIQFGMLRESHLRAWNEGRGSLWIFQLT